MTIEYSIQEKNWKYQIMPAYYYSNITPLNHVIIRGVSALVMRGLKSGRDLNPDSFFRAGALNMV